MLLIVVAPPEEQMSSPIVDQYTLKNGDNTVGRGPDKDLRIEDPKISEHHLSISLEIREGQTNNHSDTQMVIEDTLSANGTFINGYRIEQTIKVPLYVGDQVSLGQDGHRLRVVSLQTTAMDPHPEIELHNHHWYSRGREVTQLTQVDIRLLNVLMANQGTLVSYNNLRQQTLVKPGQHGDPYQWCQNHVRNIRKALQERYLGFLIVNQMQLGYMLRKPDL